MNSRRLIRYPAGRWWTASIFPLRRQIKPTEKGAAVHLLAVWLSQVIRESLRAVSGSGLGVPPPNQPWPPRASVNPLAGRAAAGPQDLHRHSAPLLHVFIDGRFDYV